ncbi:MAG TPA: LamG-like jellyroll fold domain-containing protein, partial [Candidatus Sulfotelmatobacter sp.]|nr:LamG-like jellyroll fold domain-containing protein [Candidatus Sulfotelmatobacter sp.]
LVRGIRSSSADVDYYQFSANAGDQVILAVDVPANPTQSSLNFQIQRPDGSSFVSFNSDYRGWGLSGIVTLPQTGTYLVRVADAYYDYQGEYRFRLSLARPPLQFETEDNNSLSQADPVPFYRAGNRLRGAFAGALTYNDPGDYYSLGNLLAGSTVTLTVREPASSGLAEILSIYNAAGLLMTNSAAAATNFAFTVPPGQDGLYYVLLTAATGSFGANSETALRFSGGSDYADLGSWFNYQAFTLSLWVNPGNSQNQYADILDNNHQGGINWVLQQNSSALNQYNWGPADGSPGILVNLQPNTWQHLAITRDATNINHLYLNGSLVGEAVGTGQIFYNGAQFLRLGRWGGGGRNWNGMLDDLRIWDRPLTQPEIVAGMSGKLSGSEASLVGYWPFSEGYGTTAADLSPANHPASLFNGAAWAMLGPTNAVAPGLPAQYILSFELTNPAPPQITGLNLPAEGSTSTNIITSFGLTFSEDMDPAFGRLSRNIFRYNNHSYLITDSATSWANAEALALALGGHLAAITNAAENSWIAQTFTGYGDLWLGLNNQAAKENYLWTSGDAFLYSNWSGSEPNNSSGSEWAVKMYGNGNGAWADINSGTSLRGVIEVASTTDTDADGLVDSLDPYPNDPFNAFDLRAAGP